MKHNSIIIAAIVALLIVPVTLSAQVVNGGSSDSQQITKQPNTTYKLNAFAGVGLGLGVPVRINADYKVADFIENYSLGVGGQLDFTFASYGHFFVGPMAALHCTAVNKLDLYAKLSIGAYWLTVSQVLSQSVSVRAAGSAGVSYFFTEKLGAGVFVGYSPIGSYAGAGLAMRF